MNLKFLSFVVILLTTKYLQGQTSHDTLFIDPSSKEVDIQLNIERIAKIPYGHEKGIKVEFTTTNDYITIYDYTLINEGKIAILTTTSPKKVVFYNIGAAIWDDPIEVNWDCVRMIFSEENGHLYFLSNTHNLIYEYTLQGELVSTSKFELKHNDLVDDFLIIDKDIFIVYHSSRADGQQAKKIFSNLKYVPFENQESFFLQSDVLLKNPEKTYIYNCPSWDKGLRYGYTTTIGEMGNLIVHKYNYCITEGAETVEKLVFYDPETKKRSIIETPDIYYIQDIHDNNYKIFKNSLYHFVFTKEAANLIKISQPAKPSNKEQIIPRYPEDLNFKYHYMKDKDYKPMIN